MDDYTIFCTEEQAKKALVLGAPIIKEERFSPVNWNSGLINPTAEQMIGWLQGQKIGISIKEGLDSWFYLITENKKDIVQWEKPTRREATLAAIDAALDYLLTVDIRNKYGRYSNDTAYFG